MLRATASDGGSEVGGTRAWGWETAPGRGRPESRAAPAEPRRPSPWDRPPRERSGARSHRGHEGGARRRGKAPDSRRFPGPGEFPAGLRLGGRSEILGRGESLNS